MNNNQNNPEEIIPFCRKHETALEKLFEVSSSHSTHLKTLDGRAGSLETKVSSLETKVDSLETKVDSLETKVDSLDKRVGSLEMSVNSLEVRVNHGFTSLELQFEEFRHDIKAYAEVAQLWLERTESKDEIEHKLTDHEARIGVLESSHTS